MVSTKTKNKPGRVGVKRVRPTRAQLKQNMYQHGYTAGKNTQGDATDAWVKKYVDEREFLKSLLKLKSAGAIHEAIRTHLG